MEQDFNKNFTKSPNYWPFNADKLPIIAFEPLPRVLVVMLPAANPSNELIFKQKVNQVFELVKEIGCDTSIYVGDKDQFKIPIKSSTELHLNFIPRLNLTMDDETQKYYDWRIKQWNEIISECVNNGDIVGWDVCDEPHYNNWGAFNGCTYNAKVFWQQLPIVNAMAKSLGKCNGQEVLTFFNMAASEEEGWIGNAGSYEQALVQLDTLFSPVLWSYDLYAFTGTDEDVKNHNFNKISTNYAGFYKYLNIYSKRYRDTGVPFWAYGLVKGHVGDGRIIPTPNLGMLRFETMNNLAFGAQGIVYYSIGMGTRQNENASGFIPDDKPISNKTYSVNAPIYCSPINEADWGNPEMVEIHKSEPIFSIVKQVNSEIRELSWYFWGCEVKKIMQKGSYPISGTKRENFPGVQLGGGDDLIESLETDLIGVVISYIYNNFRQFIVLVNHDPFNEQEVTITIKEGHTFALSYISPVVDSDMQKITLPPYQPEDPKPWPDVDPETRKQTVTLQPGGMAIFQYWG